MSDARDSAREDEPLAEPAWASDEYLTSGARFVRWNAVTAALGLAALAAGALWLGLKP